MGVHASKLKCLYLPAQSGKTRKAEEMMKAYREVNTLFHDGDINIWISANNKLLTHQTGSRFHKNPVLNHGGSTDSDSDDGDANMAIKDNIFTWTSGTKRTSISAIELAFRVLQGVDMILMCAHPKRLVYLQNMLENLTALPFFPNKKINIWIDEADKSVDLWKRHEAIARISQVAEITLISASFDEVFKHYEKMGIIGAAETHPPCYRCLRDSTKVEINYIRASKPLEYVQHVLEKAELTAALTAKGMRAFIPGDYTKASHEAIAEYLLSKGFNVLILNGDKKEIRFHDGSQTYDLRSHLRVGADPEDIPEEFNNILARLYKENNLADAPFAVTGYLCVQRGVTFQSKPTAEHDGFLFDYGIIANITTRAETYQTMARLFGNIGDHPSYSPTKIYTTKDNFKRVTEMETIALNLARVALEEGQKTMTKKYMDRVADPEGFELRERAEKLENAKRTVPIVIPVSDLWCSQFKSSRGSTRHALALSALSAVNPALAERLKTYTCVQTITCKSGSGIYKRNITPMLKAAAESKKTILNLDDEDKKKNNWQGALDEDGKRLVLMVYHGATPQGESPRVRLAPMTAANPFDDMAPAGDEDGVEFEE